MSEEDLSTSCSICGAPSAIVRLRHEDAGVRFIYEGLCGGNGSGDFIGEDRATALREALSPPFTPERVSLAGLYDDAGFCRSCAKFYCFVHWKVTTTGGGWCPEGHFKSLDPHWSPDD